MKILVRFLPDDCEKLGYRKGHCILLIVDKVTNVFDELKVQFGADLFNQGNYVVKTEKDYIVVEGKNG